jgi:rhamnosyltransferase
MNKGTRRVCVFAHYDKDNIVDAYVYYYLKELLTVVDKLIFVTVSDIDIQDIQRLKALNIEILKRENIGYDFYSYKLGIKQVKIENYDELIIANDSIFGPFIPMKEIFNEMLKVDNHFWGLTQSFEIEQHIQSYFMCFKKEILKSEVFERFWNEVEVLDNKENIIKNYEIGFSQMLYQELFRSASFVTHKATVEEKISYFVRLLKLKKWFILRLFLLPFKRYFWCAILYDINPSLDMWEQYLIKYRKPFLKRMNFFMLSHEKNISDLYYQKVNENFEYPVELIEQYLIRMKCVS